MNGSIKDAIVQSAIYELKDSRGNSPDLGYMVAGIATAALENNDVQTAYKVLSQTNLQESKNMQRKLEKFYNNN